MIRRSIYKRLSLLFLCFDLLSLSALYGIILRNQAFAYTDLAFLLPAFALNIFWISFFIIHRLYEFFRAMSPGQVIGRTLRALAFFSFLSLFLWNISRPLDLEMYVFLLFQMSFALSTLLLRVLAYYTLFYYRSLGHNLRNYVILGDSEEGRYLQDFFNKRPALGYTFKGFFNVESHKDNQGALDALKGHIKRHDVHVIYSCLSPTHSDLLEEIIDFAQSKLIKICIIPRMLRFYAEGCRVYKHDGLPILDVSYIPLENEFNRWIKRAFDIVFSLCVFVLFLSWMLPVFGLLIKISSRGPILFLQLRHGKQNRPFLCYKFRTMSMDYSRSDESDTLQATKNDHRVTLIGRLLRKTSLDEMPQFINVLQGKMSVVGPRPHAVAMNRNFSQQIEKFSLRHSVKPGITGLAQIKGYRGEIHSPYDLMGRIRLDKFYVRNWSFGLDVRIIFATLRSLIANADKSY